MKGVIGCIASLFNGGRNDNIKVDRCNYARLKQIESKYEELLNEMHELSWENANTIDKLKIAESLVDAANMKELFEKYKKVGK